MPTITVYEQTTRVYWLDAHAGRPIRRTTTSVRAYFEPAADRLVDEPRTVLDDRIGPDGRMHRYVPVEAVVRTHQTGGAVPIMIKIPVDARYTPREGAVTASVEWARSPLRWGPLAKGQTVRPYPNLRLDAEDCLKVAREGIRAEAGDTFRILTEATHDHDVEAKIQVARAGHGVRSGERPGMVATAPFQPTSRGEGVPPGDDAQTASVGGRSRRLDDRDLRSRVHPHAVGDALRTEVADERADAVVGGGETRSVYVDPPGRSRPREPESLRHGGNGEGGADPHARPVSGGAADGVLSPDGSLRLILPRGYRAESSGPAKLVVIGGDRHHTTNWRLLASLIEQEHPDWRLVPADAVEPEPSPEPTAPPSATAHLDPYTADRLGGAGKPKSGRKREPAAVATGQGMLF